MSINNISAQRISLNSRRIFTNNTEKQFKKSVNIRIEITFFNLHDVMKTVVVAKILHEAIALHGI